MGEFNYTFVSGLKKKIINMDILVLNVGEGEGRNLKCASCR